MNLPSSSDSAASPYFSTRWQFRAVAEDRVASLAAELGLSPVAARFLVARNMADPDVARSFLNPTLASLHDPFELRDMDRAVEQITSALRDRRRIAIFGDYDVDGLTATSLLVRFFAWLGVDVLPYIPHRLNEGYGMSRKGIDCLAAQGVELIVTVDNGINAVDEIAYAAAQGIDVVVTDHHQPGERLPAAAAVVDPNRSDCTYPFKWLSGVGVAFKLAHALARQSNRSADEAKGFLRSLIDLVALGTIADIVPLVGENRVLVIHGLKVLGATDKTGLQAMMEKLGIAGKPIRGDMVAFLIAPRLNAAGRTEDAVHSLQLLLSDDPLESRRLVESLEQMNQQRRRLEGEVFDEAVAMIRADASLLSDPVLVVAGDGWHIGILGIVASRLTDKFGRPSIVLSIDGEGAKGSARSTYGFDVCQTLHACESLLTTYGGHKMAAGLTLATDKIPEFRRLLAHVVADRATSKEATPLFVIDTAAKIEELTLEVLEQIDRLRPFGEGNPQPLVALLDCHLVERPHMRSERHLKIRFAQECGSRGKSPPSISAIGFGVGNRYRDILSADGRFDLAGVPSVNEWNGSRSVEMNIKDIRPAKSSSPAS